jgi:hypothetical protein
VDLARLQFVGEALRFRSGLNGAPYGRRRPPAASANALKAKPFLGRRTLIVTQFDEVVANG